MAIYYKYQLDGLNTHFFSQKIYSAAYLIIPKDGSKMNPKLVDVFVTLRINDKFMKFEREIKYCGSINVIRSNQ